MNKNNISHGVRNSNAAAPKKELGFEIIFYALNILAVPFSAIATYNGYKASAAGGPYMAAILAALTAVLFFGLNYIIMDRRKNGLPHLKQTLGYIFPLAISFFGNFTYFYGNTVQGADLKIELTEYSRVFDDTYTNSIAALSSNAGISALEDKVSKMREQLKVQSSPGLGHWGSKSDVEWSKINDYFKTKHSTILTPLSTEDKKRKYAEAEKIINSTLAQIVKSKNIELNKIINPINEKFEPLDTLSKFLKKEENKTELKISGEDLINDIKAANDFIISKTKTVVPSFNSEALNPFIATSASNPIQAIEHAWKHKSTSIAPAQSLFFSLIIDLVALGFIFLAFSYTKNTRRQKNISRTL